MSKHHANVALRQTQARDLAEIERISTAIYGAAQAWTPSYLEAHLEVFPEGQMVAVDAVTDQVLGMTASLIIAWNDYDTFDSYNDFTSSGTLANHDPAGRTLYGAEVMVDPAQRRRGVGAALYAGRRALVERLGLARIRAGARLPGYYRHAAEMSAAEYVAGVLRGELTDPTLTFQLRQGFCVLGVVPYYVPDDHHSVGYAALIEWRNPGARQAAPPAASGQRRSV